MSFLTRHSVLLAGALSAVLWCSPPALADKGGKHGHGHDREAREEQRGHDRDRERDYERERNERDYRFDPRQRDIISSYFGESSRAGKCPPGLAKKNNGCLPPGQARKWQIGQPLPRDLQRYPLPRDLLGRLPPPPRGHQYVRVASDILLIAVGTSMVLDAIEDLGR